jgi:hypothetical protein
MPVAVVCGRFDPSAYRFQTSKSFAGAVVGALSGREARDRLRDGLKRRLATRAPEAVADGPR